MAEIFNKREYLKNLIRRADRNPQEVERLKSEIKSVIKELKPVEIAIVENELSREDGITVERIREICDIHLELMEEFLNEEPPVEPWHPVFISMKEHEKILGMLKRLKDLVESAVNSPSFETFVSISSVVNEMKGIELHFQKQEYGIFPYVEKYGVEQPPKVMWSEHDTMRSMIKQITEIVENRDVEALKTVGLKLATDLLEMFMLHVHKENHILFPTALNLVSEEEFKQIRKTFDEIGYCCYFPEPFKSERQKEQTNKVEENSSAQPISESSTGSTQIEKLLNAYRELKSLLVQMSVIDESAEKQKIKLPSGEFEIEELQYMLNTLPVDITFVDRNDQVKYFSEGKERIFLRTRDIIGRKVQNCHPPKSVHIVEKILRDFKSGKRDHADFWIKLGDKYVLIRYFAVRNEKGEYLGTLEVTQDIAPIQQITGEKRIYDEE
ncbi:hypothetical protein SAMN04488510_10550 [Fervidobacterium changbaicum]|uniref:DUF438 domain-containing protein n=2 Tax=Fervidobacterium TaxID=2422 RepID=A0AAI8GD88_FERIS|nr:MULTISPECIES: DUF438 domain-containing protein [Fervidobacterium]AMW33102.1 DUF438 domain-containing protein [Fervidobacterium islandicum]QAV33144.1 DUF438 domain-containing protein [Fervidobacterium changbaicum]SDH11527.1 hypothetical protein SAMN04488510_10550 [Fervidobacterium changbaicum]